MVDQHYHPKGHMEPRSNAECMCVVCWIMYASSASWVCILLQVERWRLRVLKVMCRMYVHVQVSKIASSLHAVWCVGLCVSCYNFCAALTGLGNTWNQL